MTLMLHRGAEAVGYDRLDALPIPDPTPSHVRIAHRAVVDMVKNALGYYGHEIVEEHHAVTPDGARYFGILSLRSAHGDWTDTVGMRNSHDKIFPIGISFGSRVFVCDNLAFLGDHVIRRKHTANAKRDLPGLVAEVIEPLARQRAAQAEIVGRYRATPVPDGRADQAILQLYRAGVINLQRIADVVAGWDDPPHPEWGERTAWRLFNATTHALAGRIAENPGVTRRLHDVIDAVCEQA